MALSQQDARHWSGIDTVTIHEAGYLLYGIEPHSFEQEEEYSDDAHPGFYERGIPEEIAYFSEIVERAALAGSINIAYQVPGKNSILDWKMTHLNTSSFLAWCKSLTKYAATATALDLATYQDEGELPEGTSSATDWIAKSIELADAIAIELGGGATNRISARSVYRAVAKRLGELTNPCYRNQRKNKYGESMVRTQALKGWKYPRKVLD